MNIPSAYIIKCFITSKMGEDWEDFCKWAFGTTEVDYDAYKLWNHHHGDKKQFDESSNVGVSLDYMIDQWKKENEPIL